MKSFKQYIIEDPQWRDPMGPGDGPIDIRDLPYDWDQPPKPPYWTHPQPTIDSQLPDDDFPWAEGTIFLQNGDMAIPCDDCPRVRGCPAGYKCFDCKMTGTCQEGETLPDAICGNPPCAYKDVDGNWWYSDDGVNWFPWNDDVHGDHP